MARTSSREERRADHTAFYSPFFMYRHSRAFLGGPCIQGKAMFSGVSGIGSGISFSTAKPRSGSQEMRCLPPKPPRATSPRQEREDEVQEIRRFTSKIVHNVVT